MAGRDLIYISKAAFLFFVMLNIAVVLIVAFPDIVMILPRMMYGN